MPADQHDLSEIWAFTQDSWNVHQAEGYITEIGDAIERVASGRAIDVIRILHQRMDPARHM